MASTYSNLKIQLMATGENSGTWGTVTNVNLGTAIEEAIVGSADVTFSSADVTLTLSNTNATQPARNLRLNLIGVSGGARQLIVPAIEKVYIINNGLGDTVTVKNTTGNGIAVPAGKTMYVYNNGTDVVDAINHLTSLTLATPLAVTQGGTGSTSTTFANLQSNVSGVLPIANGGTGSSTGAFSGANITSINASAISSGTLDNARLDTVSVAKGGTGTVTLSANAVLLGNGTNPLQTVAPGTSGNVLTSNGTTWASVAVQAPTTLVSSVTASGTAVEFTNLPAGIKKISFMINQVTSNARQNFLVQLGTSSGYQTTGYRANAGINYQANVCNTRPSSSGFLIFDSEATSYSLNGMMEIARLASNTWVEQGCFGYNGTDDTSFSGGSVTLSGEITRIRLVNDGGTTFSGGTVAILYLL